MIARIVGGLVVTVVVVVVEGTGAAAAQPAARAAEPTDGATGEPAVEVRAAEALPLANGAAPPSASVDLELGWSTIGDQPLAQVRGELRVWRKVSITAGVQLRSDGTGARPGVGLAYQALDPADAPIGVRLQVAYKPEGFVEPEGEVEATVALTRDVGGGRATALFTYGQDPEGNERDGEAQGAFAYGLGRGAAAGATARGRRALGDQVEGDRAWDLIAGGYGSLQLERTSLELLAGVERAGLVDGARTGAVVVVGAGATW